MQSPAARSMLDRDGLSRPLDARQPARRAAPQPARRPRRLPLPRRARHGGLRRKGEIDPQARRRALLQRQGRRGDARRDRDGLEDPPDRVPARRIRGRGAADREHVHQGVQAALQRPPARRQVLSLSRHLARRGLSARLLHARAPPPRPRLLRPVLQRQEGARNARPAAEGVRLPLVPGGRARAAQRLAVPGLLHQALRRAVRRLPDQGGVPRGDRRRHRLPVGPLPPDRARPRGAHEGRRRRAGVRAGGAGAQPPEGRQEPARAPARRQRVGRHARRDRRRGRRRRRQRAGLPDPRRRAVGPPVLLSLQRGRPRARRGRGRVPAAVLRRDDGDPGAGHRPARRRGPRGARRGARHPPRRARRGPRRRARRQAPHPRARRAQRAARARPGASQGRASPPAARRGARRPATGARAWTPCRCASSASTSPT